MLEVTELRANAELSCVERELEGYDSGYLSDIISEIAEGWTSISTHDIIKFISEHVEDVNSTIEEFGWNGCGSDLYKAGQKAEYLKIENGFNIERALRNRVVEFLQDNNIKEVTGEQYNEIERIVESADNNDRLDCLLDAVLDIVKVKED